MARYLVTGGAGFIGSHIVEELVARGEHVRVLDNFDTGRRENLQSYIERIELVEEDMRNLEAIRPAFADVDIILHQAALPSVPRSVRDPLTSNASNVDGTLNVLLAARDAGAKRVVFASSSSVYGSNAVLPKSEQMRPMPISPYAVSKLAGEGYCLSFGHVYGLETVVLRYFNVFGPRQDPDSQYAAAIPLFITRMLSGESPIVFGDGEQSRDFTYVANVVHANLCAAHSEDGIGEVFNIACGQRHTVNTLVRHINEIASTAVEPQYCDERIGDVKHSQADISAAAERLGYRPPVSFRDGLALTVEWYKSHPRA